MAFKDSSDNYIARGVPFTLNGRQYPSNWLDLASAQDLASAGITIVPDPVVAPVIPSLVTMRQARLALLNQDLLASVDAAIAGMTGVAGDAARIEWEYAATVERGSSLVSALAGNLGLTSGQLDALFMEAASL